MSQVFSGSLAAAPNGRLRTDSREVASTTLPTDLLALLTLVQSLQQQTDALQEREARLEKQCRHLEENLQQAARRQRDLLPEPIDFAGIEWHTLYRPTDRVSGDFYDVIPLDENRIAIGLADVSGHGAAAGLLTPLLKRGFAAAGEGLDPAEVLAQINTDLLGLGLKQGEFVTALFAVYDRSTRTLTFARAGAPHPILARPAEPAQPLTSPGLLLGALDGVRFQLQTVQLRPGDIVYLHTDGLEALLVEGPERHHDLAETPWYDGLSATTGEAALDDVDFRLVQAAPNTWPVDDVTVLALQVTD